MKKCSAIFLSLCLFVGCTEPQQKPDPVSATNPETPIEISLAYSEYPSWSTFGVAEAKGLIDGSKGKQGPLEKLYNTDVVLKLVDYDSCIQLYGTQVVDAVCITNMDILSPSLGRPTDVVAATSTSVGADALISLDGLDSLKEQPTRMLEKSVSQYVFVRCLTKRGLNPKEYPIKNLDPAAAATALQTRQDGVRNIMVWNPFVLQTLRTNDKAKVLFSSNEIPEEVIDSIAVGRDFTAKDGSDRAIRCVLAAFYEVNKLLNDPIRRDETLVALGEKFCNLDAADMAKCCEQTRFYQTPASATKLFESDTFRKVTMPQVLEFCVNYQIVPAIDKNKESSRVGFEDSTALVNFTTKYLKQVEAGQTK